MNKLLRFSLITLLMMLCGSIYADDTTITGAQLANYGQEGGVTVNGFTIIALKGEGGTAPTVNASAGDARLYAKNTLTIKSANGNLKKLVFNISTQGKKRLTSITADNGTISAQAVGDETVTWTGDAAEVTLTVGEKAVYGSDGDTKAGQFDFDNVVITVGEGGSVTPVDPDPNPEEAGTKDNPYTVEQAIAAIEAGTGIEGVYATGIVSKIVTAFNDKYGNISYNISADGTTSGSQLQAYRGFSYNGDWFTSANDIKVGDEVVVYGNLTKYNTTYEFAAGNQLVSLVRTDNREPAGLSYDVANFTATIGEDNEFPTLTNPNTLTVAYSSTNEAIATVDATSGEITLVAAGQTTIKAVFAGDDAYEPGEASYLLVVKEKEVAGTDKFELIKDASKLADGDVIILAFENEEGKAWAMSTTQNTNNRAANSVEIEEDGKIIPGSSIQQITLEDGFYFNVGDGYLFAASTGSNWLRTEAEADDNAKAEISIDENGDATIIFQGANTRNHLRFNANNGNPMFSCYAESSSVVTLPRIYRKVKDIVDNITIDTTGYATLNTAEGNLYNLAGQKVNKNYKGIIIMNGKKMIQK